MALAWIVLCTALLGSAGRGGGVCEDGHTGAGYEEGTSLLDIKGSCSAPGARLSYLVSIRRHGTREHVCTGALIHPWYVLTAAHCVDPDSPYSSGPRPVVHIGSASVDEMEDQVEVLMVEETHMHEKWIKDKSQRSPWNVALLELPSPSSKAHPMVLVDHFTLKTGQGLIAVGWGPSGDGPKLGSDIFGSLKLEPQEFIAGKHCNKESLWNGAIPEELMCGLNQDRKASCVVDSGSPLLLLDTPGYDTASGTATLDFVVGINVDGAPCGSSGRPDLYVDLRTHADWLKKQLDRKHSSK